MHKTQILKKSWLAAALVLCAALLAPVGVRAQGSASLYLSPASGTFEHNTPFSVTVLLDTGGEDINAVEFELTYPENLVTFSSFSTSSDFEFEAPGASGSGGTVTMARGSVTKHNGSGINVATVNFVTNSTNGTADIVFGANSQAIRPSESGSMNILGGTTGASYTIFTESGGEDPGADPPPTNPPPTDPPEENNPGTQQPSTPSTPEETTTIEEPVETPQEPVEVQQPTDTEQLAESNPISSNSDSRNLIIVGLVSALGLVLIALGYGYTRLHTHKSALVSGAAPAKKSASKMSSSKPAKTDGDELDGLLDSVKGAKKDSSTIIKPTKK